MAALFKNTEELKGYLPVSLSFDFEDLAPYITLAESRYIIPLLSKEQFGQLHAGYSGNSLSNAEAKLLDLVRLPLANFAVLLYVPVGNVHISANGIVVSSNKEKKAAPQWAIEDLKKSLSEAGYDSTDSLLEYLEENKTLFPTWATSSAYTILKEFFINSAKEFSRFVNIRDSRRTFMALRATMRKTEDFKIAPITCRPLFAEIKTQIRTDTVTSANQTLIDLIGPAVAHLSLARAIDELSVEIGQNGITVFNNSATETVRVQQPAKEDQLLRLARQSREDGENYLVQLKELLDANLETYPLYRDSPCYIAESHRTYQNDPQSGLFIF